MKKFIPLLIFLFFSGLLFGETLISPVKKIITLSPYKNSNGEAKIALEESFAIDLDDSDNLLETVTISLLVDNNLKKYSDSFMLEIFKSVFPHPTTETKTYRGKKIFSHFIPYLNRIYITISIDNTSFIKPKEREGKFTVKYGIPHTDFPILVTIQPIMKGLPDWIFNKNFNFSVTTKKKEFGFLQLNIIRPKNVNDTEFKLSIDGKEYSNYSELIKLPTGIHKLNINSQIVEPVSSAFTIESGSITKLNLKLREVASIISFEVPENSHIYIDGQKLESSYYTKFQLKEGEHFIRIKIGDYSLTRKIDVKRNKNYKITVIFDMLVKEY